MHSHSCSDRHMHVQYKRQMPAHVPLSYKLFHCVLQGGATQAKKSINPFDLPYDPNSEAINSVCRTLSILFVDNNDKDVELFVTFIFSLRMQLRVYCHLKDRLLNAKKKKRGASKCTKLCHWRVRYMGLYPCMQRTVSMF